MDHDHVYWMFFAALIWIGAFVIMFG